MFGIFDTTDVNSVGGARINFWCVLHRGTLLRDRGPVTGSKPLISYFRKTTLFPLWHLVRMIRMDGLESDASLKVSCMMTEGFLEWLNNFLRTSSER